MGRISRVAAAAAPLTGQEQSGLRPGPRLSRIDSEGPNRSQSGTIRTTRPAPHPDSGRRPLPSHPLAAPPLAAAAAPPPIPPAGFRRPGSSWASRRRATFGPTGDDLLLQDCFWRPEAPGRRGPTVGPLDSDEGRLSESDRLTRGLRPVIGATRRCWGGRCDFVHPADRKGRPSSFAHAARAATPPRPPHPCGARRV